MFLSRLTALYLSLGCSCTLASVARSSGDERGHPSFKIKPSFLDTPQWVILLSAYPEIVMLLSSVLLFHSLSWSMTAPLVENCLPCPRMALLLKRLRRYPIAQVQKHFYDHISILFQKLQDKSFPEMQGNFEKNKPFYRYMPHRKIHTPPVKAVIILLPDDISFDFLRLKGIQNIISFFADTADIHILSGDCLSQHRKVITHIQKKQQSVIIIGLGQSSLPFLRLIKNHIPIEGIISWGVPLLRTEDWQKWCQMMMHTVFEPSFFRKSFFLFPSFIPLFLYSICMYGMTLRLLKRTGKQPNPNTLTADEKILWQWITRFRRKLHDPATFLSTRGEMKGIPLLSSMYGLKPKTVNEYKAYSNHQFYSLQTDLSAFFLDGLSRKDKIVLNQFVNLLNWRFRQ